MEHRHHRQHRVARAQAHHVRQRGGIGMQDGGAVAVQRGLRVARGAAGVAHAGGRVFVKLGPVVLVGLGADPGFVALQAGDARVLGQFVRVAQRDPVLHRGALGVHRLDDGQEAHVKAQHLVFGVVGNPGDLLGMQTRVDGVQHPAGAADAEIQLQVAIAVPGQRGDPVAELQLHRIQRVGDLAGAPCHVPIGIAVDIALHPPGHDFCIAMMPFGKLDQGRNQQRLALHQAQHETLLFCN